VPPFQKTISHFEVGAVAGNVKVGNEVSLLTKWQSIEYTTAQNFDRRAFDLFNGITVVPGAIGAFKKAAIEKAGGFTNDTLAEDCDLTIRIIRSGYRVVNCTEAIAVTEAPETLRQFMKQRFRWCYGVMQAFWKNRDACLKPRPGVDFASLHFCLPDRAPAICSTRRHYVNIKLDLESSQS
jgi:cellulose synthase/poly-beta-1,6-N-acetylglucosamine synthase-like glycosyltransferase